MRHWSNILFTVHPSFFLSAAAATVLLPVNWVLAWIAASIVHEFFHLIAVRAVGLRVLSVTLSGNGAVISTESMYPLQELLCALSGPLGALLLLLVSRYLPILSVCALVQSLFNLLPYYPLDGGRALYNLVLLITDETRATRISSCINSAIIVILGTISLFMQIRFHCCFFPMCLALLLFFKNRKTIIPCKQRNQIVQYNA